MRGYIPNDLPPNIDLDAPSIWRKVNEANIVLAELKGVSLSIPNREILLNTLSLQEAKDSTGIENIITSSDDLYRTNIDSSSASPEAKEVKHYEEALLEGAKLINKNKMLLVRDIKNIQSILLKNNAGIRKQPGTVLRNSRSSEVVFTPPQIHDDIIKLLDSLEKYINTRNDIDPLVSMALIHYQFETIHPFYDGNGRTGRIINILYLMLKGRIDSPILYLSGYIIKTKSDYYRLLREVRTKDSWSEWIIYIVEGVRQTAVESIRIIKEILHLMNEVKKTMKNYLPQFYSKDLLELLFLYPYTKINLLVDKLGIHRQTASKYLLLLEKNGILNSKKIGSTVFFINQKLYDLLEDGFNFW